MSEKWVMRYRFFLNHIINSDEKEVGFNIDKRLVILAPTASNKKLNETKDLVLLARGFLSKEEAQSFGERVKTALQTLLVFSEIGVNIGLDEATGGFSSYMKEELLKQGVASYSNIHGLLVYKEHPNILIPVIEANGSSRFSKEKFLSDLKCSIKSANNYVINEDLDVAIDLYHSATMEVSPHAKLILSLCVIEQLTKKKDKPNDELELIDIALKPLKSIYESKYPSESKKDAKKSIEYKVIDSIEGLKKASNRSCCKDFLERVLSKEDSKEYDCLSSYRSKIAHPSHSKKKKELPSKAHKAQNLARKV
ncbi:MAG: hypothetical protein COV35_03875 [Alphaproteobacteria bacterium CG11_big_fil_rev_8_21_14_0_20_39_49]|nr:MAG: hypothetical protein COV35_03875 [Alphaproteobacteria bacterium CG11_big_fil_rev_8_21_14_0_20_39_49]